MPGRRQAIPDLGPGDVLGGYRIEAELGTGGMGQVFRARRVSDELAVALKVVKAELSDDATLRRRFLHEARAAAAIEHPSLVGVIESGEVDGRQFLAMPLLDGTTLEQRIVDRRVLALDEVLGVATEIGGALEALHAAGLVHRDVKSANIIIDRDGHASLADFGLAKGEGYSLLTTPGNLVGTLDFLAPERIRGETATPASDVYAFGCVLFEALAGRTPFGGRGMMELAFAHLEEEPADPTAERDDIPDEVGRTVLSALAKLPADRPSAGAYAEALQSACERG